MSKKIIGFLLVLVMVMSCFSFVSTAPVTTTDDQRKADIAAALNNPAYLNATVSTLEDFHYGDILKLTAAMFIFDGDERRGQQVYLDNYTNRFKPFFDRIPFIVDFEGRVFYYPDRSVPREGNYMSVDYFRDNVDWFFDQLKTLPDFNQINVIILADNSNGFEGQVLFYEGKLYELINMSLVNGGRVAIHGTIHGLQADYNFTAVRVMDYMYPDDWFPFPFTQEQKGSYYAQVREKEPNLPPY